MADLRFHDRRGPFTLEQIAQASACVLLDGGDASRICVDVAALKDAQAQHLSFLDNPKYKDAFRSSKAGACIVSPDMAGDAPYGMSVLISKTPYRAYAMAAALFYPWPQNGVVSPAAHIDPSATIGENCTIEAGAFIGAGVVLGAGCWIGAHASLSHCILGERVRVHTGARVGQDGFGFAMGLPAHLPVPQLGRVIIEDFVNIGANTCIDRGAGPDTVIGMGCVIDNLVQIAHNVKLGRGCVIAAQTGISGSAELGDFVICGGQVGIAGHLKIGAGARIAAQSGVTKDIPAGGGMGGFPRSATAAILERFGTFKKTTIKIYDKGLIDGYERDKKHN